MVRDGFQLPSGVMAGLASLGIAPLWTPQGRLTLTTAVPVLTSTVSAAGTVYYTPYLGNIVPVQSADGGLWSYNASAEVSNVLANSATGNAGPAACVSNANYDLFGWMNAGVFTLTRGPLWSKTATVTMTSANPGIVTFTAHGLVAGTPVVFSTTGALPTNIVAGTTYYVVPTIATDTFEVSATVGGAAINTTAGTQSGTHTAVAGNDTARGSGAGTTELKRVNGLLVNANAITNGPAAGLGTYLGSFRTNATNTTDMNFGSAASNGGQALINVWNNYNRVNIAAAVRDSTSSWTYTTGTFRAANGSNTNRISMIRGVDEDPVDVTYQFEVTTVSVAGALFFSGIGLDSITATATGASRGLIQTPASTTGDGAPLIAKYLGLPGAGYHYLQAMENGDGANANTVNAGSIYQLLSGSMRG